MKKIILVRISETRNQTSLSYYEVWFEYEAGYMFKAGKIMVNQYEAETIAFIMREGVKSYVDKEIEVEVRLRDSGHEAFLEGIQ